MDDLDVGHNIVLGTKLEHQLRLGDATNQGSLNLVVVRKQLKRRDRKWLRYTANDDVRASSLERGEKWRNLMRHRDRVDNEVKLEGSCLEGLLVGGCENFRTKCICRVLFAEVAGHDSHFTSHCLGDLDCHVTETAKADHANGLLVAAFLKDVAVQGRKGGDTGTEEGSRVLEAQSFRHVKHEILDHCDLAAVAAVGVMSGTFVVAFAFRVERAVGSMRNEGNDDIRLMLDSVVKHNHQTQTYPYVCILCAQ
jgi:hypothetical protein